MSVPFVDLGWQHREVEDEVRAGFDRVMTSTAFIDGPDVAAFEQAFAAYCGVGRCVGVANGTDAIELALRAHGVGPGDEVIVPANTFIATAEAVARCGAVPVLVDCDDRHLLIDPDAVGERLGPRTRAVAAVHLYGQMAPLERLREALADRPDVLLLEDAAQAQGATRQGRGIGVDGTAATSFYPGKNLGAYGDAGAVVTDDPEIADRVVAVRNHGSTRKYVHDLLGVNSRLDTLQAVVLRAKLSRLERWNELRRDAADRYSDLLGDEAAVRLPTVDDGNVAVWHLYVVRVPQRDDVLAHLAEAGIGAGIHYPVPIHLHPAFAGLGHPPGSFPIAETAAGSILSLPIFPGITAEQQEEVAGVLRSALRS